MSICEKIISENMFQYVKNNIEKYLSTRGKLHLKMDVNM